MGSIKVTFSAINNYAGNCGSDYVAMINMANDVLARVGKMHTDVLKDYEKIDRQILRLQIMQDEVASKVASYEFKRDSAQAEADSYQREIDYLYSHPKTVTTTDEDGNETTEEELDYDAINAAERKMDAALETVRFYQDKLSDAYEVQLEVEGNKSRFELIKNAINAVGESIESDIYEIKKYSDAISDEAEYNLRALQGVLESLNEYLSSKAIFIAEGSFGASVNVQNVNGASGHIQQHKTEDTYKTSNGFSVTYLSSSSNALDGKKYTDGVVIEGQLTFNYDHQKHTVSLHRKIHQYAPGIDLNYKRSNGQTNYEAMLEGKSPVVLIQTPDGIKKTRLDLHHLTQQEVIGFPDAPYSQGTLAEVPVTSHQKYTKNIHMRYPREKGISTSFRVDKLPNHKYKPSKDEAQFNEFRKQYWKARAQVLNEQRKAT